MYRLPPSLRGLLSGVVLGAIFAGVEVVRVSFLMPGGEFRFEVLLLAILLDCGTLGFVGLLVGGLWQLGISLRRRSRRWDTEAAHSRRSRRAVLRWLALGTASVGVGALGLIVVERRGQPAGAPASGGAQAARSFPVSPAGSISSKSTGLAAASPTRSPVAGHPPPSVLLITIDTLRGDQLGSFGNAAMQTPHLDAFAKQGARFFNYQIQEPQTNPSHASIFTGMYPPSNGVRIHMVDKLPDSLATLATVFKGSGYRTAGLYSWMSFDPQYCNFQRGFDVYTDLTVNKPGVLSNPAVAQMSAAYRTAEQYLAVAKAAAHVSGLSGDVEGTAKGRADITTDAAIAQLRAFGNDPFFMWLHYFDPHYPYEPPGSFATMYDPSYTGKFTANMATIQAIINGQIDPKGQDLERLISLYQGEISYLDSQIGRLFTTIDELNLRDQTIVAISGDHGESFADHTLFVIGNDFFHPRSLYNDESRVPFLLRFPPKVSANTIVQAPAQAIDVFATLLDLAGVPVPGQSQGRSLVPLISGSDTGVSRESFALMPDYTFTSIVVPGWKLIQNNATGQRRLYDLAADPGEQHDVFQAHTDLADRLSVRLNGWMKAENIS